MQKLFVVAAVLGSFAMAAPIASAAAMSSGNGKYCLKGPGETMHCNYQTLASCIKAKSGSQSCVIKESTTGAAPSSSSNGMKK